MLDKRLLATFFIWGAVAYVINTSANASANVDVTGLAIVSFIAATISMAVVWIFGSMNFGQDRSRSERRDSEKAKRQLMDTSDARVQLLLQMMTEDELARLKSRLLNEVDNSAEGELSLNDLMAEHPANHRR